MVFLTSLNWRPNRDFPILCKTTRRLGCGKALRKAWASRKVLASPSSMPCLRHEPLGKSGEAFEVTEGPWPVMQTPRELHGDPHVAANEYLKEVAGGSRGRFALVATPVQFDDTQLPLRCVLKMGEPTDEVLRELAHTQDELMNHKVAGVIH